MHPSAKCGITHAVFFDWHSVPKHTTPVHLQPCYATALSWLPHAPQEANLLAALRHPNVTVRLRTPLHGKIIHCCTPLPIQDPIGHGFKYCSASQSFMGLCLQPPVIVMEYYSHGSLYDVLKRARESSKHARQLSWALRLNIVSCLQMCGIRNA